MGDQQRDEWNRELQMKLCEAQVHADIREKKAFTDGFHDGMEALLLIQKIQKRKSLTPFKFVFTFLRWVRGKIYVSR